MTRWPRRRLSTRPENVKRRLANRVAQVLAAIVLAGGYYVWNTYIAPVGDEQRAQPESVAPAAAASTNAATATDSAGVSRIDTLYANRTSNEIVTVTAPVKRVLKDDNDGSRHQRFILELPSGLNILVAHNIDLAPRVPGIAAGDSVTVRGEYEWDERGGVLHWTHHDPAARHQGGWIEFDGKKYE